MSTPEALMCVYRARWPQSLTKFNDVMGVCDKSVMRVLEIEIDLRLAISNIAYNYNSHVESPTI
jgi:hypothetical protein